MLLVTPAGMPIIPTGMLVIPIGMLTTPTSMFAAPGTFVSPPVCRAAHGFLQPQQTSFIAVGES